MQTKQNNRTRCRSVRMSGAMGPSRAASCIGDRAKRTILLALWPALLSVSATPSNSPVKRRPHIAVIGSGWAGFGAAKTLCEACGGEVKVTLLDVLPDPTGNTPYLTPTKKPFEAGFKGFWKDYPNINSLVDQLGLDESEIFTPFTNSSFYSPAGLEATAPVFSNTNFPQLPSPLGQIAASAALFERLPLRDRASMAGLLYAMLDMYRDEETFAGYDRMTAHELFIRMRLSKRLVDDFLKPTLLIGLFKPPEEVSAAVTMELLYFYALAHQNSFDVRWIKGTSIAKSLFAPLCEKLNAKLASSSSFSTSNTPLSGAAAAVTAATTTGFVSGGDNEESSDAQFTIMGSCRVEGIDLAGDHGEVPFSSGLVKRVTGLRYTQRGNPTTAQQQQREMKDLDGIVLALGAKGLRAVMTGSPALSAISPELTAAASMGSIDVISSRLWLDKFVPTRTPANVFSRFKELRGAGGTFFMLDQLQNASLSELWGCNAGAMKTMLTPKATTPNPTPAAVANTAAASSSGPNDSDPVRKSAVLENTAGKGRESNRDRGAREEEVVRGSVVAVDFYNAGGLLPVGDEALVQTIIQDLLPAAVPEFKGAKVLDSYVQRYPGAVSWFSPGSYSLRPTTVVPHVPNLFCAGDWVILGSRSSTVGAKDPAEVGKKNGVTNDFSKVNPEEHGAKGLCQERAFVSGILAANKMLDFLAGEYPDLCFSRGNILPVREDEPQVRIGRRVNARLLGLLKPFGLANPWLR